MSIATTTEIRIAAALILLLLGFIKRDAQRLVREVVKTRIELHNFRSTIFTLLRELHPKDGSLIAAAIQNYYDAAKRKPNGHGQA